MLSHCFRTFVSLPLTRESWCISRLKCVKIYSVYANCRLDSVWTKQSSSYLTWRDTICAILFLDTRENGCVRNGMFLMIFARVFYTCTRAQGYSNRYKFSATTHTYIGNQLFAIYLSMDDRANRTTLRQCDATWSTSIFHICFVCKKKKKNYEHFLKINFWNY